MKTSFRTLSGLFAVSALAFGLVVVSLPATAANTITGSEHDLSDTNVGGSAVAGTEEICVFCHTPHGANTNVTAPIWNKALPATAYTAYTSSTMDGTAVTGSVSLACLSCHDGTQARDNMINQPGSGGYTAAGSNLGTLGSLIDGPGMDSNKDVTVLTADLSNDHPIGMTYCAAANQASAVAGNCADDSFNVLGNAQDVGGVKTNGTRNWVEAGGNSTYSKSDFPLYGSGVAGINVECATCHDPHAGNGTVDLPLDGNTTFLRRVGTSLTVGGSSNSGSGVCLTCHNK